MSITGHIKLIIRLVLLIGTIISLFFVPWSIVKVWLTPLPDTVQQQVNKTIEYGFDGIIVYVDMKGYEPNFFAAGINNKENNSPANPHSLFKIASIGKLYDAVATTKLLNTNCLSLEKTLADYFPELVGRIENAELITLKMMLQHRSGIPNYTNTPNFWTNPPKNNKETLERILDLPARFKPGKKYEYSNTNYLLISELIEKVVGYNKFEYISKVILKPLGLKNTFNSIHDVNIENVMSGYYVGSENDIKSVDYGSMIATAQDVGIFVRALNTGLLLDDDEKEIYSSVYTYSHTGLIPGYQSIARYYPDIDAVIVQFTNTTDFDGYNWTLSEIAFKRITKILRKQHKAYTPQ